MTSAALEQMQAELLAEELLGGYGNPYSYSCMDPLNMGYSFNYSNVNMNIDSFFSSPDMDIITHSSSCDVQQLPYDQIPQFDHLDFNPAYPCPKRQRCFFESTNTFVPNYYYSFRVPQFSPPELMIPSTAGQYKVGVESENESESGKQKTSSALVSAQSIAARERRKKITDKTQELGRLVPGGHKMNTAEMLQAAFKYVKFLQAQLGILQSLTSLPHQESKSELVYKPEELQVLLGSPRIQEKLYIEESCLIPSDSIQVLMHHRDIKSNPSISRTLKMLT
ncbi:Myc-type, basic helix-loop-helix (bHLH) domain [Dillenia turbinata]|uniref:Myc-type, basic helix-loop-helix (BHLH) domain n=1 Tax=Dillenia turbinata TaxID=194707 RepID=A0AAN8VS43_9MAGN